MHKTHLETYKENRLTLQCMVTLISYVQMKVLGNPASQVTLVCVCFGIRMKLEVGKQEQSLVGSITISVWKGPKHVQGEVFKANI